MIKCIGCGALLQNNCENEAGFTTDLNYSYCKRCFEIKHYNKYFKVPFKNYNKVISEIDLKNDLILLVSDFLNLYNLENINFKSPTLLVITKADLIPRNVNNLLDEIRIPVLDKVIVSSKNNFNFDLLYSKIIKYKKSKNVYVVGYTNGGKSTLINKIAKNYGKEEGKITVSNLPSTTVDLINTKINDELNLIDTPGLLDAGSLMLKVDKKTLNKIIPKREIRPLVYQIKCVQSLLIEDFAKIKFLSQTNIVIYMSNSLKFQRIYKDSKNNFNKYNLNIKKNQKLIVKGLGFIEFKKDSNIILELVADVGYLISD